jgi:nucleoside-diphosphate-sugar epimerase
MTETVLVTGAGGYLGARLVDALVERGHRVRRASRRELAPHASAAVFDSIVGDTASREMWQQAIAGCTAIVHLAAQTSTYVANADPLRDAEVNLRPLYLLLDEVKRADAHPLVVLAGAATQVGLTVTLPVDESLVDQPVTIYDLHKLQAEQLLLYHHRQGAIRGACLRLANVYGPGPASSSPDRGVLNLMVRRALREEDLTIYGTGEYVRDYIYIDDVVDAFIATVEHGARSSGRYYVLGSGQGHTVAEAISIVRTVAERRDKRPRVTHVPMPDTASPIETRNFIADTRALTAATGWHARISLDEGLERTFAAFERGLP